MGIRALDHVQVAAPPGCEAAARAFYGGLLGLTEIEKPEPLQSRGGAWFALPDGRQLHIGVEPEFTPSRKAHPAFLVTGLPELTARLAGAGAPVSPDDTLPGVERCYTEDSWGNRIELVAA